LNMKFFLRKGVEFSDGEPLDADDVIYTFNLVRNPAINADRDRSYLTKLKEVRKIDQYTVEFVFSEYYYLNFGVVGAASIMPEHFYSKFTPDQYNEKTGLLMGSGPYKLENPENWSPGKQVILYRNERYWGTPPTFDRIVFNEVEGENIETFKYGNQEQDLVRCTPEQYKKLLDDKRIMGFSRAMEFDSVYKGYSYCAWNQLLKRGGKETPTRFAEKRLRQAMTLLLDRERMARDIYMGYAKVSSGPFSPTGKQSNPDIKPMPFDESAGKAILKELGYIDRNNDGVVEGPDGTPFRFTLTYPSGNETTEKIILFMKDSYARAGIVLEPDRVDWPVLVKKLTESDFEAVTLGFSANPESDPYQIFHSSQIVGQGDNRTNYINKDLDAAIEKARVTVNVDERMKVWHKVHAILAEDQPYTFLFHRKELRLFNNRISNIQPATIGLNFDYLNGGMIPWFVPKEQQKYTK
jgi:peptide/nickel transport system substrate-binding protein